MRQKECMAGSITVEASLAVPIFVIVVFAFMYLFESLVLQCDLQDRMIISARNYANYGIQTPFLQTEDGSLCHVDWEIRQGKGYCQTDIKRDIPGISSGLLQIHLYQRIQVHDYTGRSMMPEEAEVDERYVYVAENGRVYHLDMGCTYLHLGIQTVMGKAVGDMRNQSGGKYKACETCTKGKAATEYSWVYITPYGARYHREKDCSGLRRTIRKVSISSVGTLPPCSKCGK
ncbi:MAG: hypothetical protein Q4D32_01290 [Eubacteriales bacterium]|nr:hypothetical protein [Eubacteriales bacterium]